MNLTQLVLNNYGTHRALTVGFRPGLNGILGANGAGKSTLFYAIRLALLGENAAAGVKDDNIFANAAPNAPAFVELDFEHDGIHYKAIRNLRGERTRLIIPGGEIIKEEPVTAAILDILGGVKAHALSAYTIVDQGRMFDFLELQPAKRLASFQTLFGLDKFQECGQVVTKEINSIRLEVLPKALEEYKREMQEAAGQLAAAEADLAMIDNTLAQHRSVTELETAINAVTNYQNIVGFHAHVKEMLAVTEKELADGYQRQVTATADHRQLADALQQMVEALHNAQKQIGWHQELADIQKEEAQLVAPNKPDDANLLQPDAETALETAIAVRAEKLNWCRTVLANDPSTPCPTCGATPDEVQERVRTANALFPDLLLQQSQDETELANHKLAKTAQAAYEMRLTCYHGIQQQLTARRETVATKLAWSGAGEPADIQAREAELLQEIAAGNEKLTGLSNAIAVLDATRQRLTQRVTSLKTNPAPPIPDNPGEDAGQLRKELVFVEQMLTQRAVQTARVELLQRLATTAEDTYRKAAEVAARHTEATEWRTFCTRLKEAFHTLAPEELCRVYLQQMLPLINQFLNDFKVPFYVELGTKLSFLACLENGSCIPADRLSYAQRVILALAFRLAVYLTLANQTGLLMLDEPTASLDSENVQRLIPVLERLQQLTQSNGMQVILITHHRELAPWLNHLIEL